MKEKSIFTQQDWNQGNMIGSEVLDNNLINRKIKTNEANFSEPSYCLWDIEKNDKYENNLVEVKNENENIYIKCQKESNEKIKTIRNTVFQKVIETDTRFYNSKFKDGFQKTKYLEIDFSWKSIYSDNINRMEIHLNKEEENFKIQLTNDSKIQIINKNKLKKIDKSSEDSIGDLNNFIDNNLSHCTLKFIVINKKIYVQFEGSGYKSIWYEFKFKSNKIEDISLIQTTENKDGNNIIDTEFEIHNVYVKGYDNSDNYISKIIDSTAEDTVWKNIDINSTMPYNKLIPEKVKEMSSSSPIANYMNFYLFSSNKKDKLKKKMQENEYDKKIKVSYNDGNFVESKEISKDDKVKGRYLQVKVDLSGNRYYQNNIDYIKIKYLLDDEVKPPKTYEEVDEKSTEKTIGESGGIVKLKSDNFSAKLYIPPGALTDDTDIKITRLSGEDDRLPDDFIGFEFGPSGINFLKTALLEVDYEGFRFGTYQNEDDLSICYLREPETIQNLEELDTELFKDKKIAVSYINHFSIYGITAKESLYSSRTENMVSKMPNWMNLQEKEAEFHKFLNFAAGRPMDEFKKTKNYYFKNKFINKADLNMKSASFKKRLSNFKRIQEDTAISSGGISNNAESFSLNKVINPNKDINEKLNIYCKGKKVNITYDSLDFFENKEGEICLIEKKNKYIHFEKPYKKEDITIEIVDEQQNHGQIYQLINDLNYHHIWNVFDEFGLLVGLDRLPRETNKELKERILDVFKNPGNSTTKGLINSISRELGLKKDEVNIELLNNPKYQETLFKPNGQPTNKLIGFVETIDKEFNIYWDRAKWDMGYWDSIEKDGDGYTTLPTTVDYEKLKLEV